MAVSSIRLNNGNTITQAQPTVTANTPSFKAYDKGKEAIFIKANKESFIHKYRDIIGFLAGGVVGDVIWSKGLGGKVEGLKNMTKFKSSAIYFALSLVTGFIGSMIALQFGKSPKN